MNVPYYTAVLVAYSCARCGGTLVQVKTAESVPTRLPCVLRPIERVDPQGRYHPYFCSRCDAVAIEALLALSGEPVRDRAKRRKPGASHRRAPSAVRSGVKGRMLEALFEAQLV